MQKRGQAALEFLMTYGWAVMAGFIIVGVLWYVVGDPSNLVGDRFNINAPFAAEAFSLDENSITIEVRNGGGESVSVTEVSVPGCGTYTPGSAIGVGVSATHVFQVNCSSQLSDGRFGDDINIFYTTRGSSLVKTSSGTVSGSIDAGSGASCVPSEPGTELSCSDGQDNDCDGDIDGADSDCAVPIGLIAHYPLDGNFLDSSGNGYNGSCTTCPTNTTGQLNGAYNFSGIDQSIDLVETPFDFERNQTFSVCSWINIDTSGNQVIVGKLLGSGSFTGWELWVNSAGALRMYLISAWSANAIHVSTNNILAYTTWQHVCMTYDGSSSASGVNFYLDGVSQSVNINVNGLNGSILNDETPQIGARGTGLEFDGKIDEVRIYEIELSASQVSDLYNSYP